MDDAALPPTLSRGEALHRVEALLAGAGLPEPAADARILLEEATGLRRFAFAAGGGQPLGAQAAERLEAWVPRRLAREPVFRILGEREFWGLTLRVTPDVLDPRPDTETVVEAVLQACAARRNERLRVLDLGTGSGALLCAVLHELPKATGLGIDRSASACAVAEANLIDCGLGARARVTEGDWAVGVAGRFDVVLCNPPYIPTAAIATLAPEVRDFDPLGALDGGPDGLACYRAIIPQLPALLASGGIVAFEVGAGQAADVAALLPPAGLTLHSTRRDLGGHERAVLAGPPA